MASLAELAPVPVNLADAFEVAAARARRAARASRNEGATTKVLENYLPHAARSLASLPERATESARTLNAIGEYDPAPVLEAALMTMGATPFSAPRGAMGAGPIRAYHGSPYDFERFDMSKIGTGEGAQAYGHGLYFAENPSVARDYRKTLSGVKLDPDKGYYPADPSGKPVLGADGRPQYFSFEKEAKEAAGRMYEVNIRAEPEQFLDWDRALSQQPQNVAETLREMGLYPRQTSTGAHYDPPGSVAYNALASRSAPRMDPLNIVGIEKDRATAALRDAGIPGIRYLDQGSRPNLAAYEAELQKYRTLVDESRTKIQADPNNPALRDELIRNRNELNRIERVGPGTSNYVLFRDDIIDILRKYGLAGAAAMPAVQSALSEQKE